MIVDFNEALKASAQNQELAERLLRVFIEQIPSYEKNIKEELINRNISSLRKIIHKLHGAVQYLGVPALKSILASMEYVPGQDDIWLNQFDKLLEQLNKVKLKGSYH